MSKGRDVGMRAGTLSTAVLFLISDHSNSNSQNAIRNCGCHFLGLRSIDGQSGNQLLKSGDYAHEHQGESCLLGQRVVK